MAQALRDAYGRELHLDQVEGYSLDEGVLSIDGAPLFLFDDPLRLDPKLMDAIAGSIPGSMLSEP